MINPFYCFVGEEMMVDLKLPLKPNRTVWAVLSIQYCCLLSFSFSSIFAGTMSMISTTKILGLLFAVLITGVLTDAIKDAVGRPRPDFFWCCFPDGIPRYDDKWGNVICHGNPIDIKEGYKSFLRGHTSCQISFELTCIDLEWRIFRFLKCFSRRSNLLTAHLLKNSGKSGQYCLSFKAIILIYFNTKRHGDI
ncbi:Lipid phosphate phosphatase 2 [Camellia lanceoleosa]|uniref:Lipid phosphate phosphatase 2 n=1 Tax=Camellia lanceoleosa TaxID=1840588 RepID=A0ACC0HD02_9ERIC|nr:Lipid phosphate phosphatase 2 [Camellia lanceoleosa]